MDNKRRTRFGEKEIEVISRFPYEKKRIASKEDLDALFKFNDIERNKIVHRLKKKRVFSTIKRGVYIFSPLEYGEGGAAINEMLIPPQFLRREITMLDTPRCTYVGGHDTATLAPDGSCVGGRSVTHAPDSSCVGGNRAVLAPDGTYVGTCGNK